MAWYTRVSLAVLSGVVLGAVVLATYRLGQGALPGEMTREVAVLARQAEDLRRENERLRTEFTALEHRAQIEQTTHGSLQGQMRALADENAELKEELAFFHTLMNAGGATGAQGVTVERFRVRREVVPGEYRFQLLVAQARPRSRAFAGRVELVVDVEQDGRSEVIVFPKASEPRQSYGLRFKFYQRVDGVFRVQPDAKVNRVQVRVLEDGAGAPVSSQTVSVS
ncbi:MAG: hypothetical protein IT532_13500 [Burkholderiales bacterium]|nr:hypothetical protein [Burkholderiales bacterium]